MYPYHLQVDEAPMGSMILSLSTTGSGFSILAVRNTHYTNIIVFKYGSRLINFLFSNRLYLLPLVVCLPNHAVQIKFRSNQRLI
jgi:hypothetical protein